MKEELINKIIQLLNNSDIDGFQFQQRLYILFSDYEITKPTTELALPSPEINEQIIQKFLLSKAVSGRSERTIHYYDKQLHFVFSRVNKVFSDITSDDIRLYLAIRQAKEGITKNTANNELHVLRSFFTWCSAEDLLSRNPTLRIELIKTEKSIKKAFTEYEVEKIRDACCSNKETAFVEVLLSTGCRVSELVNIRLDEIKTDRVIVHGKGNKDRIVYLNAKAQLALTKYINDRNDSNPFLFPKSKRIDELSDELRKGKPCLRYMNKDFIELDGHCDKGSIEQQLRKIGKRAEVDKVHPHRFRRTCATFALHRGMPIEQVSKMLGHENISTTQIYLDLSQDELEYAHKKYVV